jgi:hypothetical protein
LRRSLWFWRCLLPGAREAVREAGVVVTPPACLTDPDFPLTALA